MSPTGNYVALWEGPLEYKLHIMSLAGVLQGTFVPDPDPGFGIRNVAWHPQGLFLAVAGWDDKVHVLDSLSWSPVCVLELSSRIPSGVTSWREPAHWLEGEGRGFLSYEKLKGMQTIAVTRADPTKPMPKSGAAQVEWNKTGSILLVRWENVPKIVHLYSFPAPSAPFTPKLRTILTHSEPVLHARWNPVRKGNLALCCGTRSVYIWSDEWVAEGGNGDEEEIAECIGVPTKKFANRNLRWSPDGKGFILMDKEMFCCAFEVEEGEDERPEQS